MTKTGNHKPISLMINGAKVLNKVLAKWIQQRSKSITHHNQEGHFSGIQGRFHNWKSVSIKPHVTRIRKTAHNHLKWHQKSVWQNSTPFHDEHTQQTRKSRNYLNIIKYICENPTASVILNSGRLRAFPLISGARQGCPLLPLLLTSPGGSRRARRAVGQQNK